MRDRDLAAGAAAGAHCGPLAIGDLTYTAVRGAGAQLNGTTLRASAKTSLDAAIVATGRAETGQHDTYRRIGESITAMLGQALLVGALVPSTFPMLLVARGQNDVFWQYQPVLPGIAAGILLVTEAGDPPGTLTVGANAGRRNRFPRGPDARISRATVAVAMLDEAETPHHAGVIAVPLPR